MGADTIKAPILSQRLKVRISYSCISTICTAVADLPEEAEKLLKDCHPDWSTASWAIRFVASQEGVYRVLSGMNTLEQVDDNTTYMQNFQPLTAEEQALLQKAAGIIRAQTAIPCTGCGYCAPECPKNIAIPNYFALYNGEKRHGSANYVRSYGLYYNSLAQVRGKASDCIKCGRCEKACPQHLAIRDFLQDVAAAAKLLHNAHHNQVDAALSHRVLQIPTTPLSAKGESFRLGFQPSESDWFSA
ncbi:MAG TPA: 4Fe-4S dicluster domain-containing protein [Candidatus Acutalibacter pullicola]|uniref:4Fe-4S dicluster domain-containing protein n=1 Tax=Candidatus Acutalibacter pullicola TaxID=2838417 RepID=A0A9D2MY14_9FIRM|nr:4Fe-4S dicluster domain-containing protein [Candidatus Acutalibacter pullicola]